MWSLTPYEHRNKCIQVNKGLQWGEKTKTIQADLSTFMPISGMFMD